MRKYKKHKVEIADVSDTRAHKVVTLHRDKVSGRSIARSLGIGRNTVRKVLAEHDEERKDGAPLIQEQPAHGVATEPQGPRDRPHAHAIAVQRDHLVRSFVAALGDVYALFVLAHHATCLFGKV